MGRPRRYKEPDGSFSDYEPLRKRLAEAEKVLFEYDDECTRLRALVDLMAERLGCPEDHDHGDCLFLALNRLYRAIPPGSQ